MNEDRRMLWSYATKPRMAQSVSMNIQKWCNQDPSAFGLVSENQNRQGYLDDCSSTKVNVLNLVYLF